MAGKTPGGNRERTISGTAGAFARSLLPWAIACGILAYLFARVPVADISAALERVSVAQFFVLAVIFGCALLAADSFALWVGFRESIRQVTLVGEHRVPSWLQVVRIRGASYLLAILNYGAGQGGVVYFLRRHHGVPVAVGAGAVLLTTGAFLILIALVVGTGALAGAVPERVELRMMSLAVVGALPVYLLLIGLRPQFLARRAFLAPLFDAGVRGTLRVACARVPHVVILIVGHWLALRIFDVRLPLEVAMARLPVLFLVSAVPISPSGLGTTQAAAVTLFSAYAPGTSEAAQQAAVLGYSLSFHFAGTFVVATIGLICLRLLGREKSGT